MLRTLENILGSTLIARDGEIGTVHDFFLEDAAWRLRYVVVETGTWLNRRRVLIAPAAFERIDGEKFEFHVNLTRNQVETSPDVDTDKPVSRQQEILMNAHYGWPAYWAPDGLMSMPVIVDDAQAQAPAPDGNRHLRSFRELSSYAVEHGGDTIARSPDLIIDDQNWSAKLIVVVLGGWIDGRPVALPIESINHISWSARTLTIAHSKEDLEKLPTFEPHAPVNKVLKVSYYDYRGKPVSDEQAAAKMAGGTS